MKRRCFNSYHSSMPLAETTLLDYNPFAHAPPLCFVRFVLFVILFLAIGKGLNRVLPLIHFPDRSFTRHKSKFRL